ncbi:MAG: phosphate ABC transporter permease subunit PstC [Actinobacteria bacterium]|nr:phosphate ABC transporter permease subunit PstC [Actinomycetota bacterium]
MSVDTPAKVIPAARKITTKPRVSDQIFRGVVTTFSFSALVILSLIALFLLLQGFSTLREQGFGFITHFEWSVATDDSGKEVAHFGLQAMLVGTVVISFIALIIAVPLAVLTALFLTFYAPTSIKRILVTLIDLMAAFPSILYGLWGYFVLMPMAVYWAKLINHWFGWIYIFGVPQPIFTRSPFIAGIVLSVMIIPIITSVSREVFSQTPLDRIQAAYALGATKWGMIRAVVLPFGSGGIVGGSMLGLGRAFGETVAVFSVLNIVFRSNFQILFTQGGNVASMIIQKFGEAGKTEINALIAAGLVLFILTLLVNFAATFIVTKTVKSGR